VVNGTGCGRIALISPYARVLEGKIDIAIMKLRIQTGLEDQSPGVAHAIAVPEFILPDASFLLSVLSARIGLPLSTLLQHWSVRAWIPLFTISQ